MNQRHLFPIIREKVQKSLSGYIVSEWIQRKIDDYIVPARLGNRAGVLGAIALAQDRGNSQLSEYNWIQ